MRWLIFAASCLLFTELPKILAACDDRTCQNDFGEFGECTPEGNCACKEFYVLQVSSQGFNCIPVVSYNKTCMDTSQCQGTLGTDSWCNKTTSRCECHSLLGEHVHYYDGHCYALRALGEPCTVDSQCMLSHTGLTNPLARCVDSVCSCYQDAELALVTHDMDGICMAHCEECTVVDLSLFATTMAGSVVLVLFIYVVFKIARAEREDESALINDDKA